MGFQITRINLVFKSLFLQSLIATGWATFYFLDLRGLISKCPEKIVDLDFFSGQTNHEIVNNLKIKSEFKKTKSPLGLVHKITLIPFSWQNL